MMKQILIAVALAAVVMAGPVPDESEFEAEAEVPAKRPSVYAFFPVDEAETSKLKPGFENAGPFCIEARDTVKALLKSGVHQGAASVFTQFFNTFSNVVQQGLNAQREVVATNAEKIRSGQAPEPVVDENGEVVKQNSVVLSSFMEAGIALVSQATGATKAQLREFLDSFKGAAGRDRILSACTTVAAAIKAPLESKWAEFRKTLGGAAVNSRMADTGCITVGRIVNLDKVCNFANMAQSLPMFN